jgi:hypothetical protein
VVVHLLLYGHVANVKYVAINENGGLIINAESPIAEPKGRLGLEGNIIFTAVHVDIYE